MNGTFLDCGFDFGKLSMQAANLAIKADTTDSSAFTAVRPWHCSQIFVHHR